MVIRPPRRMFRNLIRDAGIMFVGTSISAFATLGALGLASHGLGPSQFGTLVIVTTYALLIDRLANFQSWQYVITYGAAAEANPDADRELSSVVRFGRRVDMATAMAGVLLALAGIPVLFSLYEVSAVSQTWVALYTTAVIGTHIVGTPMGLLRLSGRYTCLAGAEGSRGTLRMVAVGAAVASESGLPMYVAAWGVGDLVANGIIFYKGGQEAREKERETGRGRCGDAPTGSWRFLLTTNLHASLKLGLKELDVLVVGAILQPAGAGTYRIIKQLGAGLTKLAGPLYQVILPHLSEAAASNDGANFRALVYRPMIGLGVLFALVYALFALVGQPLIETLFGSDQVGAYGPALIYLFGTLIATATLPLHPALLAAGKPSTSLSVLAVSTGFFIGVLGPLTWMYGLAGASLAYVGFYAVWAVQMMRQVRDVTKAQRMMRDG